MKLGTKEFGQWRVLVLDDFEILVSQPQGINKYLVKSGPTYLGPLSKGNLAEMYTYRELYIPYFVPLNVRFDELPSTRVLIYGFRYIFERIEDKTRFPETFTVIPLRAVAIT